MYRGTDTRPELPTEPNSFIGRERDLAELAKLLIEVRALTLSGPGGIGRRSARPRISRPEGSCTTPG